MKYKTKTPFITTTHGMSGFFAALFCWDDVEKVWEVEETGIGMYGNRDKAEDEGKRWAANKNLRFV